MAISKDMLTHRDMFIIRRCVVSELGSFNKAALWSRIEFRAHGQNRDAVLEGGRWWWRVRLADMAEDLGLSQTTIKKLLGELVAGGYVEQAEHNGGNAYDHTKSYRCVVEGEAWTFDESETGSSDESETGSSSSSLNEVDVVGRATRVKKVPGPLPDDWVPSKALIEKANALKVDWVVEVEKMRRWAFATETRRAEWGATFSRWIANAKPVPNFVPPSAPAARGFGPWFDAMLADVNTPEVERVLGLVFPMPDEVPPGVSRAEFLAGARADWLAKIRPKAESRWLVQFGSLIAGP